MKRFFLLVIFSAVIGTIYAQRIPVVGVMEFEAAGTANAVVTAAEAAEKTRQVIEELRSWGTLNVVQGDNGAEYVIRGTLSRQGGNFILSGATVNPGTGQILNEYREQARTVNAISIIQFCTMAVERVPLPNYLLGTWQSTINMPDGPVICIIEFKSDRTVIVERYDTWEHRQNNSLRYEGFGSGVYTYTGFANRMVTVNTRQIRIDAIASVRLSLEETLPEQTAVNRSNLQILFNSDRTSFEIINGMLPCGRNFDGPSVHPSEVIGFSQFRKIR